MIENNPTKTNRQIPTGKIDTYTPKRGLSGSTTLFHELQDKETQNNTPKNTSKDRKIKYKVQQIAPLNQKQQ